MNAVAFFITEEAKETVLDISKGTVEVLWPTKHLLVLKTS